MLQYIVEKMDQGRLKMYLTGPDQIDINKIFNETIFRAGQIFKVKIIYYEQ